MSGESGDLVPGTIRIYNCSYCYSFPLLFFRFYYPFFRCLHTVSPSRFLPSPLWTHPPLFAHNLDGPLIFYTPNLFASVFQGKSIYVIDIVKTRWIRTRTRR